MRASTPMSLIGTLHEFKIENVLRLFATGKKSGVLTVADGANQALVRFQKGAIIHASAGRLHGEEALLDLFGWKEGQLTFVPEERSVTPNIVRDVDALILEGLKVGDSFHRMRELIPTDRVVFQLGQGPGDKSPAAVGATEWRVLRLADGVAEVGDIIEASEMPKKEVLRILFELTEAGLLERVDVQKSLRVTSKGLLAKEAAEVDDRFDDEWRKVHRFDNGVLRIEVRTLAGKSAPMSVAFKAGLARDIHIPRNILSDLGLREGDEVLVRPVA